MNEKKERKVQAIRKLVASAFKVVPWGYRDDLGTQGEVSPEEAHRVRCGQCKVSWRYNQGYYIRKHYQSYHGFGFGEAIDAWLGLTRIGDGGG